MKSNNFQKLPLTWEWSSSFGSWDCILLMFDSLIEIAPLAKSWVASWHMNSPLQVLAPNYHWRSYHTFLTNTTVLFPILAGMMNHIQAHLCHLGCTYSQCRWEGVNIVRDKWYIISCASNTYLASIPHIKFTIPLFPLLILDANSSRCQTRWISKGLLSGRNGWSGDSGGERRNATKLHRTITQVDARRSIQRSLWITL